MPERLAQTDPFKQITEVVGSGPFRFVADEYVAGSRAMFAKFDGYAPARGRAEQRGRRQAGAGGPGRVAHHPGAGDRGQRAPRRRDRLAGDADPGPDPALKQDRGVVVGRLDPYGLYPVLRFNHLQGPTTNRGAAPDDPGRDRPARGDAGGDGRRREHLQRADRLLPAGHAVCERRGDGPARRPKPLPELQAHAEGVRLRRRAGSCCCTRPTSRSTTR